MNEANIGRRTFLTAAGLGAAALAVPRALGAKLQADKPNFIIIFADDQGYQDMGCFGSPKIKTPNFDTMAAEGMRFTDFYSACSVCSPSRAALLTGCYPPRVGVTNVLFPRNKNGLNPKEITIADMLKARGYATQCVGKWHVGHLKPFLPTSQGFDSYFGIPYSNDMTIDPNAALADDITLREGVTAEDMKKPKPKRNWVPLMRDEKVVEYPADQSTLTKRYTEESIKFITANKDKPFFLYLPHTLPHVPLFASPKFKGKSARGLYGDTIEEIDWGVGQIIAALKKLGIDGKTLIVYTSDNGPWLSKGKAGGCALPLRGGKFQTYEGGMREPTIMRWPGKIPAGKVCKEVAGTIDLLPTLGKLAGADVPADRVIDGKDIWPLMTAQAGAGSPHAYYYYYRGTKLEAVRSGKWKLRTAGQRRRKPKKGAEPAPPQPIKGELYDLRADIGEKKNIIAEHPDVAKRLAAAMAAFDKELKANSRPAGKT